MNRSLTPTRRAILRRLLAATLGTAVLAAGTSQAAAHGPDPTLSGFFRANQDLRFRWRAGSEPASAIKSAIQSAAADANASRGSKAATFTYDANGANPIGYG